MLILKKSIEILKKSIDNNLYQKLIEQVNKDLLLANIDFSIPLTVDYNELYQNLNKLISELLKNNYDAYLTFIYRIDISESKLKIIESDNFEEVTQKITYLIIEREFQKVWLKSNFK